MIKIKYLKFISVILFLTFIVVYSIGESGYYEYKLSNKKNLTEEQIKKFENDVKEGKDIDIKKYLIDNRVDYTNNLSRVTYKISDKANRILKKGIESVFKYINKLVED